MEMQQIRYFIALSQTLNFTRAAELCHVSQPTLTRAIRALEAELGGDLIRRERAKSHLTALGQRMVPLMQQCYDAAASVRSLAKAVRSNDLAPLSLGFSSSINIDRFVQPLSELFRAFPGAQLRIRRGTGQAIDEMLKTGEIELAVAGPLAPGWDRRDAWPLFEEPMAVVVHADHRLARQGPIAIDQLAGERFLTLVGCEMAEARRGHLAAHGIASVDTHEVETDHDLMALLEANAGVSVRPASAPASGTLREIPVAEGMFTRTVSIYGVAGRARPPIAATLLNLMRAADWRSVTAPPPAARP
jgi:DNA-binding transcriptional LysR family regulator